MLYEADDPITSDSLTVERDGERLLLRSLVDGRERTIIIVGADEAQRLARALVTEFDSPACAPVLEAAWPA